MSRGMSDVYGNLKDDTLPLCLCSVNISSCKVTKQFSSGFQGRFAKSFSESMVGENSEIFLLETFC